MLFISCQTLIFNVNLRYQFENIVALGKIIEYFYCIETADTIKPLIYEIFCKNIVIFHC